MKREIKMAYLPETKEAYQAPHIEIVEVEVEKGVQMSPKDADDDEDKGEPSW